MNNETTVLNSPDLDAWIRFYSDYPFMKHRLQAMKKLIDVPIPRDEFGKRVPRSVTLGPEQIDDMLELIGSFQDMLTPLFDEEEREKRLEIRRKTDRTRKKNKSEEEENV